MRKKLLYITTFVLTVFPIISANAIEYVDCGNVTRIPKKIPQLTSLAINVIQVAVPIILVIMGSIDLLKGLMAQKEDEIKKGRQILIKRLIVATVIFFVVAITKLFVSIVSDNTDKGNITECIDCFLSGSCEKSANGVTGVITKTVDKVTESAKKVMEKVKEKTKEVKKT